MFISMINTTSEDLKAREKKSNILGLMSSELSM